MPTLRSAGTAFLILAGVLQLAVAPLQAQSSPIAPRPSVLFERAPEATAPDSTSVDHGISRQGGAMLGMVAGGVLGYFLPKLLNSGGSPTCDLAGPTVCTGQEREPMGRTVPTIVGIFAGMFVGNLLAEH